MPDPRPIEIRRFEVLSITSIAIGLIHQFALDEGVIEALFSEAIALALTLLISRGRQNWARWVLLVMFLLGVAFVAWQYELVVAEVAKGYPVLTIAVTILQAVALVLLFTKQSSAWLRGRPSPA